MSFVKLALPPRFQVVRRIGEGGMGVVYEAIDVERGERVALKTILHHDADTVARVKHEFRSLQDIHHPNLVTLRELVADADDVFFTMDLVDGVDLMTWIRGPRGRVQVSSSPTAIDLRPPGLETDTQVDLRGSTREEPWAYESAERSGVEPAAFDEGRLRDVFRQVALGLSALHAAGKVHRDVKPPNVRVTPEGRVVLLDFGLVFEVDARQLSDGNVVGTPAYMAPEQASLGPVGPEADWYAVGVMLYECLTGRRPFEGAAAAVLLAKHYQDPLPPSAFVTGIPRDLEELSLELLRVEPRARPTDEDVRRRLQVRSSDRPATGGAPFVGRDLEIQALERAFGDVLGGGAVTVALLGESGVGKSCLVRRFFDVVLAGRDDVLVLTGRCYERESVPYKALDEVIENLSRRLGRMSRDDVASLIPPGADSLSLIFPAMGRVPALASHPSSPDRDPLEQRRVAFRAIRELLRRLSARQRLVITIDDLQWTDADSVALLQDVLRPPDAPAILLVVTMRGGLTEAGAPPALVASLPGEVRAVHVDRLASDDARRLAEVLLAQAAGAPCDAAAIAKEAGGHPLFIDELVRHASLARDSTAGALRLDDALWRRVLRLDEASRRVLDVACLLGAPVSQEVVAHAAGVDMGELAHAVSLLRATHLVRTQGARVTDAIEPFHDRVREALVARLDAEARRTSHARIAAALELAKGSDPEVLATHWAGANEPAKAARYALVAAEQAGHALAFERSARLFELALGLLPEADPRRRGVREQLGDALANAGDCARAATAYEAAAKTAGPMEALDLRRRAAEQLMRAGEMVRGLDAARGVLAAVGLPLPRTMLGAFLALLWFRLLIRLRGLRFVRREAGDVIAPAELTRIDVCWSVAFTLPYADPLAAGVCHARHVLLALGAGDPVRAARALAMEASYLSTSGFKAWPRAERVLAAAKAVADDSGDPYAQAIVFGLHGIAACTAMHFEESIRILKEAVVRFRAHVPGSAFEITTGSFVLFVAMAYSGRYGELRPLLEGALVNAKERGDRYGEIMLRLGILNSTWIFAGEPGRARREIAEARRRMPDGRFRAVNYQALVAECYVDLYDGEYERAYALLHATLPAVRRSLILQLQAYRAEFAALRGRASVACAMNATGRRRAKLLREATRSLRDLGAMPGGLGRVNVRMIRANVAVIHGRREEALDIAEAMASDDADDSWLSRQAARLLLGRLRGDASHTRAAEEALAVRGGAPAIGLIRLYFPALEAEIRDRSSPSPASSPGSEAPSLPPAP